MYNALLTTVATLLSLTLPPTLSAAPVAAHPAAASAARSNRDSVTAAADTAVLWVPLSSDNGKLRGQLPQLLTAEIAKAVHLGRTPFIEVGASWCGPCQELEESLRTPAMIDAFAGAYIIHLDADDWDVETELQPLGFDTQKVDCSVLPFIGAIDRHGHVVRQLRGDIKAASIKQFIHTHLWHNVRGAIVVADSDSVTSATAGGSDTTREVPLSTATMEQYLKLSKVLTPWLVKHQDALKQSPKLPVNPTIFRNKNGGKVLMALKWRMPDFTAWAAKDTALARIFTQAHYDPKDLSPVLITVIQSYYDGITHQPLTGMKKKNAEIVLAHWKELHQLGFDVDVQGMDGPE